jgi:hypothetical protein
MNNEKLRHEAIVYVDEEEILSLLRLAHEEHGYVKVRRLKSIPPDATIKRAFFDFERCAFGFVIEHARFPGTPAGQRLPVLDEPGLCETTMTFASRAMGNERPRHKDTDGCGQG